MYYLKDLSLIGCNFIAENVKMHLLGKTLVNGKLYYNGKEYPAYALHYSNGRPSKLYNILGNSPKEAEHNMQEILDYVEYCIIHNVNGIQQNIRRRFLLSYIRILTTLIAGSMLDYSIYLCIIENFPADLILITSLIAGLGALCLYVNSVTRRF